MDLWTPACFGVLALSAHFKQLRFPSMVSNWIVVFYFHMFMALWGNFGYAGNWGIVTGLFSVTTAILSLVCHWFADIEDRTFELGTYLGLVEDAVVAMEEKTIHNAEADVTDTEKN